mmetsp:Transcript_4546/g.14697  ORF Transcript_4546/g.14697 Transcript_4546/m.14697 type:complete len:232 (+) Transcript_4546:324-1019(+)
MARLPCDLSRVPERLPSVCDTDSASPLCTNFVRYAHRVARKVCAGAKPKLRSPPLRILSRSIRWRRRLLASACVRPSISGGSRASSSASARAAVWPSPHRSAADASASHTSGSHGHTRAACVASSYASSGRRNSRQTPLCSASARAAQRARAVPRSCQSALHKRSPSHLKLAFACPAVLAMPEKRRLSSLIWTSKRPFAPVSSSHRPRRVLRPRSTASTASTSFPAPGDNP